MPKIPNDIPWKPTGKTISQGGQAVVEEVEPVAGSSFEPGRYAMKILRNTRSHQAITRFDREIKAIKSARIDGVIEVIDFHVNGSQFLYYVMPNYVERGYIALDSIAFSPDSPFRENAQLCLEFTAKCADVLFAVHELAPPVIHRDIKPANILCHLERFEPVLLDFGCCQIAGDEAITLTDEGVGTKDYMAPECESGAGEEITAKADLYSLGKIIWSLVTGKRAFSREQPGFNGKDICAELPHSPQCWHLTRILERSVRRAPANRFENAQEMARICRWMANSLCGIFPPLEMVGQVCPACGQSKLENPNRGSSIKQPIQMHMVFGNPMPAGVIGFRCPTCGYLAAWDTRILREREKNLETME